jgi:hypothetical protein
MPKFKVRVDRTEVAAAVFVVEAADENHACRKARALAGDHAYGIGNSEYEAVDCEELEDGDAKIQG